MRTGKNRRGRSRKTVVILIFIAALAFTLTQGVTAIFSGSLISSGNDKDAHAADCEEVSFFQKDRAERYDAYAALNPSMKAENVVWQVNADLDKKEYIDADTISAKDENRHDILVNKHNGFREGYEPYSLVTGISGILVTPQTDKALDRMAEDAASEGLDIQACSGYRSYDKQKSLYEHYADDYGKDYADRYSARPGFSEHHTGRAVDLISPAGILDDFESTEECKWVHKNAWKYGFILRYPQGAEDITGYSYEPWHITYVGNKISEKMRREGIDTFEEYCGRYMI